MSHATSAMPERVVLDWRHGSIGPLAPCVLCGARTVCRSPVKDVPCHKALRRDLDHQPRPRRIRPRPADPRLHPRPG